MIGRIRRLAPEELVGKRSVPKACYQFIVKPQFLGLLGYRDYPVLFRICETRARVPLHDLVPEHLFVSDLRVVWELFREGDAVR